MEGMSDTCLKPKRMDGHHSAGRDVGYIAEFLASTTDAVESRMRTLVTEALGETADLESHALALVDDAGHRLLSALLRSAYEGSGRSFEEVVDLGTGIELLQISTLLVDDVLDEAETRNGQPTILLANGAKEAVVVGLLLSSLARRTITQALFNKWRTKEARKVLNLFDAVEHDVYVGQFLDLRAARKTNFSEGEYLSVISKTTATFIRAPLVAGAILWQAPHDLINRLRATGFDLGMAYQLRDDVIDFLGDPSCTGKPRLTDLKQRRMRLPIIHALANLEPTHRAWLQSVLEGNKSVSESDEERVLKLLESSRSLEYVIRKTEAYCDAARQELVVLRHDYAQLYERLTAVANLISTFD